MRKLNLDEISRHRLQPDDLPGVKRFPVYVLLDNIRSLYNVGSIFRTADAALVRKIFLCGITGTPPRKEIDKTSLGAVDTVPWEYHEDAPALVGRLKSEGVAIYALEHTAGSEPHWQKSYRFPCCLVIGNEVWGVDQALLDLADAAVEIPMFGTKHSFNAGVAFGISIYEIIKQLHEVQK